MDWLRARADLVLGLLVVVAWAAVAVEADRSMRATTAATAEALMKAHARNPQAGAAPTTPDSISPDNAGRQTRS